MKLSVITSKAAVSAVVDRLKPVPGMRVREVSATVVARVIEVVESLVTPGAALDWPL